MDTGLGVAKDADGSERSGLLLGRERELETIERAMQAAAEGHGSTLLLAGPAGIGKTALTRAAAALADSYGATCLSARGHEHESNLSFGAVRQLLERPLQRDAALRELVLTGSAALAAPALSLSVDGNASPMVGATDPDTVLHGLFWVCSNLAEHGPLLMLVDDVHWADARSIRFLGYLSRRIEDVSALLLIAYRAGETVDGAQFESLVTGSDAEVMDLAPLSVDEATALIRAYCGDDAHDEFCRACHEATGGNPFMLRELVRSVADEAIPPTAASVERISSITPAAVMRSVSARLGRLSEAARGLAGGIAVAGPQTDQHVAARIAGLGPAEAAAGADALAAAGIVTGGRSLEFVHPLIRTAVYDQLGPGERTRSHSVAADIVGMGGGTREEAATHLLHVPPTRDPRRVRILVEAGEEAVERGAPEAAVVYLLRALDEPPTYGERGNVLFELGRAEAMLAARESLGHLSEAVELASEADTRIAILRETAYAEAANFGLVGEAYATMQAARELAVRSDPDFQLLLHAEQETWGVLNADPPLTAKLDDLEQACKRLTGATTGERAMLSVLAWARMSQAMPADDVRAAASAALAGGKLVSELGSAALAPGVGCWSLAFTLSPKELEPVLPPHARAARQSGSRHAIGVHMQPAGVLAMLAGRLRDAEAFLREALDALVEVNSVGAVPTLGLYVDVLRERGETDAAWHEFEALGYAGELPPLHLFALLSLGRGRLRAARGDLEGGLQDVLLAGEHLRRWGIVSPAYGAWRSAAAEIHRQKGQVARATELLEDELAIARRAELPYAIGRALRLLARCDNGRMGIERMREAVETLEHSGAGLEHAHSLVDLGAMLRRANHRGQSRANLEEARDLLRAGVDLAHRCGANPLVERGQSELRATGARPRRLLVSGPDSLTASERRAAQMAAEGMSNREIAEALFVTLKTVEKHLGNAYSKLSVASRHELGDALARPV